MTTYVNIRDQVCPNSACHMYGKCTESNVVVHSRQRSRLKCTTCGKTWAVYRDEINYGFRSDKTKIENAIVLLNRGESIRKTARAIKASPSTVQRWKNRAQKMGILLE